MEVLRSSDFRDFQMARGWKLPFIVDGKEFTQVLKKSLSDTGQVLKALYSKISFELSLLFNRWQKPLILSSKRFWYRAMQDVVVSGLAFILGGNNTYGSDGMTQILPNSKGGFNVYGRDLDRLKLTYDWR